MHSFHLPIYLSGMKRDQLFSTRCHPTPTHSIPWKRKRCISSNNVSKEKKKTVCNQKRKAKPFQFEKNCRYLMLLEKSGLNLQKRKGWFACYQNNNLSHAPKNSALWTCQIRFEIFFPSTHLILSIESILYICFMWNISFKHTIAVASSS